METPARPSCPTDEQLALLQHAVPGQAPADLAFHLAECEHCQQRALFGPGPRSTGKRRPLPEWPTPRRTLLYLAAALVALALLLYSLQRLAVVAR
jgi:hypothetical protein